MAACVAFFPLSAASVFAEDIGVTAAVDKTAASLEDTIDLSITVSGTQNPPPPQLPPLPDFRVQSLGTSSSVEIVNLKMKSSVTFTYRLTPLKTGDFTINPATVTVDGKSYASAPIALTIKEAGKASPVQDAPVFAQLAISNDKPYVNEQAVLTFKLFRKVEAKNFNLNMSYDNFRKEDLGKNKEYQQTINGVSYQVHELSVALYPSQAGKFEIPPAILDLDIVRRVNDRRPGRDPFSLFFNDPFFGGGIQTEHKTLRTKSIPVEVLPLPHEGKPDNFSNLTGEFNIFAALSKQEIEAGDSVTLTVTISGKGNVKDIPAPAPDFKDKFKVYPDQPQFNQRADGDRISGEKTFKFALIPLERDKAVVPPVSLAYFDPKQKKYVVAKTKPLTIQVRPSQVAEKLKTTEPDNSPDQPRTAKEIKILGKDILPIHTDIDGFRDMKLSPAEIALYAAGLLLPPILFLAASYYRNYKLRLRYDAAFYRNRSAYKLAKKRLDGISSIRAGNPKEFVKELSRILREYVGDKLNLQGTAFTPREVAAKLRERNYREDQVQSTCRLLEKCESLQYASASADSAVATELLGESLDALNRLEKQHENR